MAKRSFAFWDNFGIWRLQNQINEPTLLIAERVRRRADHCDIRLHVDTGLRAAIEHLNGFDV